MTTDKDDQVRFFCDAMLGGLARWLRAAGYDAEYEYGIDDAKLVRKARETNRMILTSDGPMLLRRLIKQGHVRALYVPGQMGRLDQLRFVMKSLNLRLGKSRCMACGGELVEIPRHEAASEAPPLAFRHSKTFWRCTRCHKLLWHGTHWDRVSDKLHEIQRQ